MASPQSRTEHAAIPGEELGPAATPAGLALRGLLALLIAAATLALSVPLILQSAQQPLDPLLRIAISQPQIIDLTTGPGRLHPAVLRALIGGGSILLLLIALPWFRASRTSLRERRVDGSILRAVALTLTALWTIVAMSLRDLLEQSGIAADAPLASVAVASGFLLVAQSIAQRRLRRSSGSGEQGQPELAKHLHGLRTEPSERLRSNIRTGTGVAIVSIVAAIAAVAVWTATGGLISLPYGLMAAIAVLFAAAPCAFILSCSVPSTAALERSHQAGVTFASADALDRFVRVAALVTSREGGVLQPDAEVSDMVMIGVDQRELLRRAAAVEIMSDHPVAAAIVRRAGSLRDELPAAAQFRSVSGGAEALVGGERTLVGNPALMQSENISTSPVDEEIDRWEGEAKTAVIVASGSRVIGVIGVRREPAEGTAEGIARLRERGVKMTLVSSDTSRSSLVLGQSLGFDAVAPSAGESGHLDVIAAHAATGLVGAVGDEADLPWITRADVPLIASGNPIPPAGIQASVRRAAPLRCVGEAMSLARTARARSARALRHAAAQHLFALPLVSGVFFPLSGWMPQWMTWVTSPILGAVLAAVVTVAVTDDRLD